MNLAKFLDQWAKNHPVTEPTQDLDKMIDKLIFGRVKK